jgi:hypothetical protein
MNNGIRKRVVALVSATRRTRSIFQFSYREKRDEIENLRGRTLRYL